MSQDVNIVLSLLAIILSIGASSLSVIALIKCIAAEKSTHTVTFQPVDDNIKSEVDDSWATPSAVLKKQHKLFKEDMEEQMPEFAEDEEDMKVHSF
jgi:hypothetical protein